MTPDETVVRVTENAPWLPPVGRAEAFRGAVVPRPMSVVRLLLTRGDHVFCIARAETGLLDLPMRVTLNDDPHGAETMARLAYEVIGARCALTFVGAVRNVVEAATDGYAWPTPLAHFGLWTAAADPSIDGVWLPVGGDESPLREKHWYPIVSGLTLA